MTINIQTLEADIKAGLGMNSLQQDPSMNGIAVNPPQLKLWPLANEVIHFMIPFLSY